jgi:hypothetical protein
MERKVRQWFKYVMGATCQNFNSDRLVALTIGKSVLQPIEPTVGKKGPRSQP